MEEFTKEMFTMCVRPPSFKAYGKKWNQAWLIAGLATISMAIGTAQGQVTIRPNAYVESQAISTSGTVLSGKILPVFNSPLQALATSGASTALADGTFISSPGYALMRLDLSHSRDQLLASYASTVLVLVFDLTESMEYELTGEYVYLGDESGYYGYTFAATGCIYCGVQLLHLSTTAKVGLLPLGERPDGPISGILAPGAYGIIWDSNVLANIGENFSSASGFFQLELGTAPCLEDLNDDDNVNVTDLLDLLGAWGPNPGHAADINSDGNVNVTDLLALLAAWGVCP